jgi:hypothetical protein
MEKQDSTIYFKSFVDTSTQLTLEEKDMLKDGSIHVLANEAVNEMKFVISLPFKRIQDLAYLRENYMKALDKLDIKDQLKNKEKKEGEDSSAGQAPSDMASGTKSILLRRNLIRLWRLRGRFPINSQIKNRSKNMLPAIQLYK